MSNNTRTIPWYNTLDDVPWDVEAVVEASFTPVTYMRAPGPAPAWLFSLGNGEWRTLGKGQSIKTAGPLVPIRVGGDGSYREHYNQRDTTLWEDQ